VADIPQHLLDRAAARRAALAGGTGGEADGSTPAAPAPAASASVAAAVPAAAAAVPTAPVKAASAPVVEKVPAPPKGSVAAKFAAVFFLAVTPIWAFFMYGAFGTPQASANSPEVIGKTLYNTNCAACHNADGSGKEGGAVGRPLWHNNASLTFPDPLDQAGFVKHGSCAVGKPYGDPDRPGGQHIGQQVGIMPNFANLSDKDIMYIVAYERSILSVTPERAFPLNLLAKEGAKAPDDAASPPKGPIDFEKLDLVNSNVCGDK
jgi:Cytochrome c